MTSFECSNCGADNADRTGPCAGCKLTSPPRRDVGEEPARVEIVVSEVEDRDGKFFVCQASNSPTSRTGCRRKPGAALRATLDHIVDDLTSELLERGSVTITLVRR